ncbi:hypothetical protein CASFOL_010591 [Castilleja foliolosa]|uniref:Uncharacterized protein n=1 Tax=Castilleja foliolosa TaxID=1961234 RepID=A0ABD3DT22_9LAMI
MIDEAGGRWAVVVVSDPLMAAIGMSGAGDEGSRRDLGGCSIGMSGAGDEGSRRDLGLGWSPFLRTKFAAPSGEPRYGKVVVPIGLGDQRWFSAGEKYFVFREHGFGGFG